MMSLQEVSVLVQFSGELFDSTTTKVAAFVSLFYSQRNKFSLQWYKHESTVLIIATIAQNSSSYNSFPLHHALPEVSIQQSYIS